MGVDERAHRRPCRTEDRGEAATSRQRDKDLRFQLHVKRAAFISSDPDAAVEATAARPGGV